METETKPVVKACIGLIPGWQVTVTDTAIQRCKALINYCSIDYTNRQVMYKTPACRYHTMHNKLFKI